MPITALDHNMLALAERISAGSPDPSTKTGCVIVDPLGAVVSTGFNRLPKGICPHAYAHWLSDRETKLRAIVHCERVAIIDARRDLAGCTLYVWPFMTCAPCAGMIVEAGIERVVAPLTHTPRWQADFVIAAEIYREAGVRLDLVELQWA